MVDGSRERQIVDKKVDTIEVTEKDNGVALELKRGETLAIKLECVPGTGYSWHIAKNDDALMEMLGEPTYEAPKNKTIGGMEYKLFRFKALSAGTDLLELQYKRIWEKEKKPQRIFSIKVKINPEN